MLRTACVVEVSDGYNHTNSQNTTPRYDHTGLQHEIIHELMVVTVPSTNSAYH